MKSLYTEASTIQAAQQLYKDDVGRKEGKLAYTKTNVGSLPSTIKHLQEENCSEKFYFGYERGR